MAWNRYAAMSYNPLNWVDPSGHKLCPNTSWHHLQPGCTDFSDTPEEFMFVVLPVSADSVTWIQWYGGTGFAFADHEDYINSRSNYNYDGYAQGFHAGLDLGAPWGTPVYAGFYGTVVAIGKDAGGFYITIRTGDYEVKFQALDGEFLVDIGDKVDPYTQIAGVGNHAADKTKGNTHVHIEVRYSSTGNGDWKDRIANPLYYMDMSLYNQIKTKEQNSPLVVGPSESPYQQISPLIRGGTVLWCSFLEKDEAQICYAAVDKAKK